MRTELPGFVVEEIRRRRESRAPIWNAGIAVGLFVTTGGAIALWKVPAPPPPPAIQVAQAYMEARFDGDWVEAWSLMCSAATDAKDFAAYAEAADNWFWGMPNAVEVSIEGVDLVHHGGIPALSVALTVTSGGDYENFEIGGEVFVVEDRGALRICDPAYLDGA